jgi:hypothetical protein
LYGKFYNKRPVATGLDRFFLRCGPIRTGPKRSGYGPLISGSVYTGCSCQLPRFEVKNQTRLDFKTLYALFRSELILLRFYLYSTTYPSPNSLSVCELPFATTPSTPSPNPQVHERLPLRMVPHSCNHK